MTYLYYDPASGAALYTITGMEPDGAHIEVPDDFDPDLTGVQVIDGVPVRVDLAGKRVSAIGTVNTRIGSIRAGFVTIAPAQEMIYQGKEAEAIRYLALDPEPDDLSDFPFISAEAGVLAPTAHQVAMIWINMSHIWRQVAATLEAIRIGTANRIESAASCEDIADALDAFEVALAQFDASQAASHQSNNPS